MTEYIADLASWVAIVITVMIGVCVAGAILSAALLWYSDMRRGGGWR